MAHQNIRILLVDSNTEDHERIRDLLSGHEVVEAVDRQAFDTHLEAGGFDLVMVNLGGSEVGETGAIARVREAMPGIPVIVLDEVGDGEPAFRVLRLGAADYLPKTREPLRRLPGVVHAVNWGGNAIWPLHGHSAGSRARTLFSIVADFENRPLACFRDR